MTFPAGPGRGALAASVLLLFGSAAFGGGVSPWIQGLLLAAAAVASALVILAAAARGTVLLPRGAPWLPVAVLLVLAAVQLVPLPAAVLEVVAPAHRSAWERFAGPAPARPLSLAPGRTEAEAWRLALLTAGFFLFACAAASPTGRRGLAGVVVALAVLQTVYGLYESFSGHSYLLLVPHPYGGPAVAGTYVNKNHFAGLIAMAGPLLMALLLRPAAGLQGMRWRVRVHRLLGSPRFFLRFGLAGAGILLFVGVFLSLSRAGTLALLGGTGFVVFAAGREAGWRRSALWCVGLGLGALALLLPAGMDLLADRLKDAATGRSPQLLDRLDLLASARALIRDFPVWGIGLGAFASVFSAYQSGRFGDAWALYLHNDVVQLFCEAGVIGGGLFAAACLALGRRVRRTPARDPNEARLARGAFGGLIAIGLHSLADANLSRIPANGLVCLALLALFLHARGVAPVRALPAPRLVAWGGALLLAALAAGVVQAVHPRIAADVLYNRGRLARGLGATDYFLLPVSPAPAGKAWAAAHRLVPRDPRYLRALARSRLDAAEQVVRAEAAARLRALTEGMGVDNPATRQALEEALGATLRQELRDTIEAHLEEARRLLLTAVALDPVESDGHILLARVLRELGRPRSEVLAAVRRAILGGPHRPAILYEAGLLLVDYERAGALGEFAVNLPPAPSSLRGRALVLALFRRALQASPGYARHVYPVLADAYGDPAVLMAATPRTVAAYNQLVHALRERRFWEALPQALATLERLGAADPAVQLRVARERAALWARLGRYRQLAREEAALRSLLRRQAAAALARARALRRRGRSAEALAAMEAVLASDPAHPEALVEAAELASLPRSLAAAPARLDAAAYLHRLVLLHGSLPRGLVERARRAVRYLLLEGLLAPAEGQALSGALLVRAGKIAEALHHLGPTRPHPASREGAFRQWFRALALEKAHRRREAVAAWRGLLQCVPTHGPAREALARLGVTPAPPVATLQIAFGGELELRGLERGKDTLNLRWRALHPASRSYRVGIALLDAEDVVQAQLAASLPRLAPGEERHVTVALPRTARPWSAVRLEVVGHGVVGGRTLRTLWGAMQPVLRPRSAQGEP